MEKKKNQRKIVDLVAYQDATGNKKMAKLAELHSDNKEGSPLEPFIVWELAPKLLGTTSRVDTCARSGWAGVSFPTFFSLPSEGLPTRKLQHNKFVEKAGSGLDEIGKMWTIVMCGFAFFNLKDSDRGDKD